MSNEYSNFSCVYDKLIEDVDYEKLCKNLLEACKKYSHKPHLVLDAACGTGNFTAELLKNGFDVIGVDFSPEMLAVAREKTDNKATLICQDLCELDLYGTIDTAFCMLDSLNHITDYDDFKKAISRISLFLEPEGLMIFDVNTVFKHEKILSDNIFTQEKENIYMIWENTLFEDDVVNINMDFFVRQSDGRYDRLNENFDERAYSEEEISQALSAAGLEILETRDFFTNKNVTKTSEKVIYITRKAN